MTTLTFGLTIEMLAGKGICKAISAPCKHGSKEGFKSVVRALALAAIPTKEPF
jgi:hypothetical protein